MTKKEKKQLISTLRATASGNKELITKNKSLTAKLAYVLQKTDAELLLLDDAVLQEHLSNVYTYINKASAETTKSADKKETAETAAQAKKKLTPKNTKKDVEETAEVKDMFPATFVYELQDAQTNTPKKVLMTRVTSVINNMNDVIKLQDEMAGELYVTVYWPKKFLNNYEIALDVPAPKNGFDYDLDVSGIALITSSKSHIYAMSTETEGMYFIRNKELSLAKDKTYRKFLDTEYDFYTASDYVEPQKQEPPKQETPKQETPKEPTTTVDAKPDAKPNTKTTNIPADIPETDETPKKRGRKKKLTPTK